MPVTAPNSPCINVCNIGPHGWCQGCFRTLAEIAAWIRLDASAQWAVLDSCAARRAVAESSAAARA